MISEESVMMLNSALITVINYALLYIHIENNCFKLLYYYITVFFFNHIHAALVSRRDKKHKKSYRSKTFDW